MKEGARPKEDTRKELIGRLQQLRRVARLTSEMYLAGIQSDLVQLIERAGGATEGEKPLPNPVMKRMIEVLDEALAKEPKGSLKALRRIEEALDEVARIARTGGKKG